MAPGGSRRLGEIEVCVGKGNIMLAVQGGGGGDWNGGRMSGVRARYVMLYSDRKSVRKRRWGPGCWKGFCGGTIEELGW